MITSLYEDLRRQFHFGNAVNRLIIINGGLFVVTSLLYLFTGYSGGTLYHNIIDFLSLPSSPLEALTHFWSWITYNFLHRGFFHLLWNMLFLYWFGRIVGDLIGDKHIVPLYLLGGIAGGILYILGNLLLPYGSDIHYIIGSSASVMAIAVASAAIAPDYELNLLLIGRVKLKYIVLVLVFLDIVATAGDRNTGGHFAHLGGAVFGYIYLYLLRRGINLSGWWVQLTDRLHRSPARPPSNRPTPSTRRPPMRVVHKKKPPKDKDTLQERIDAILDKINQSGYDSLSEAEKEILYQAAKDKK